MNSAPIWRSRPVFITSTFRDMHAERDWLRTHVFPELEERLRARRHHLEPIDLRWGVETAGAQDETGKEMQVLKVCLAEIERARPFQIVLLGERYGWVPPAERLTAATREAGFEADLAGQSITALEIAYGALAQTQRQRCYFYFRDPLPRAAMSPAQVAEYAEGSGSAAEQKLAELKQRIEREMPQHVRHYGARWDAAGGRVADLETFGRQVLDDLWMALDEETANDASEPAQSWQQLERFVLEQFIEERARGFLGRGQAIRDLVAFAMATDGAEPVGVQRAPGRLACRAVCITAAPGAGKSALFAELQRRLSRQDVLVLAHAAGISARAGSVNSMLRRWVQELAQALAVDDPLAADANTQEVVQTFQRLLGNASTHRRVVLLIDALNQFEPTAQGEHLTWLPALWPDNARLIATTLAGVQSEALAGRPFAGALELAPLTQDEAAEIARAICMRYHRALNVRVLQTLVAKQSDEGGSAAGNPLWLSMAVEELNLLDADDFGRVEREFSGNAEEKLVQLLLAVAGSLPADIEGLYDWLLDRAGQLHGKTFVQVFVALVAASRYGLREQDFKHLVPQITGEVWDDLRFAALRRTLRSHLVSRGAHAQWDVHHAQFRQAIAGRYLADEAIVRRLHGAVARYLMDLPRTDPLHESETMAHLMQADERAIAAQYYGGAMTDGEARGATAALANAILAGGALETNSALAWTTALAALPSAGYELPRELCERLQYDLDDALQGAALHVRHELLRSVKAALAALASRFPSIDRLQRDLSVSHLKAGDILVAQGRLAEAMRAYEMGHAIRERLVEQESGNAGWQGDLSLSQNKLGDILVAQGKLAEASSAYERALAIRQRLATQDPNHAGWQRDLAVSHEKAGDILVAQGKLAEASSAYERALAIRERLAAQDPNHADWQRDLSISYDRIGAILVAQGKLAEASSAYERALAIRERLAAQDPNHADWQRDLAVSQNKLGDILVAQGKLAEALSAYERALAIRQRLATQDPNHAGWQRDLAVSHEKAGDILVAQGKLAEASSAYERALAIRQRLATQDPNHAGWQRDLAVSHEKAGDILVAQGKLAEASSAYERALAIRERLAAQDPNHADWQRDLSISYDRIGAILVAQGKLAEASSAYERALAIRERLAAQDPNHADWQRDLSISYDRIGDVLVSQGKLAEALRCYEAGLAIAERLATQDTSNAGWQRDLAVSQNKLGDILVAQGRLAGALSAYERALAIGESLAAQDPNHAGWQRDLAVSCHKLATLGEKMQDAEASRNYYDRCRQIVRQMKQAGIHLGPLVQLLLKLDFEDRERRSRLVEKATALYGDGKLEEAFALMQRLEQLCRETDDVRHLSWAIGGQGTVLQDWGRFGEALALHREQERMCRALVPPHPGWLATSLINQAEVIALHLGKPHEGLPLAEEAYRITQVHGLVDLNRPIAAMLERITAASSAV